MLKVWFVNNTFVYIIYFLFRIHNTVLIWPRVDSFINFFNVNLILCFVILAVMAVHSLESSWVCHLAITDSNFTWSFLFCNQVFPTTRVSVPASGSWMDYISWFNIVDFVFFFLLLGFESSWKPYKVLGKILKNRKNL